MRVVIDTNILISREQNTILNSELQELIRVLAEGKHQVLVHPLSLFELAQDKDENRKQINLSKIGAYTKLEEPPNPKNDAGFFAEINLTLPIKNQHEEVDINLIYSIHKNAADFLITEDRGIHTKAEFLHISQRVFDIAEALAYFRQLSSQASQRLVYTPAIKEAPMYNIDISDSFFESLKKDYEEFEDWWGRKSREGRKAWVHYPNGGIGALLIYKIEDEVIDTSPSLPKKKRLKISTLKVTHFGYKIGELFIKISVNYAVSSNIDEIYLTHFTIEEDYLTHLITEFGFMNVGKNQRGEDVFLKKLIPDILISSSLEMLKKYYPSFCDGPSIRKFIIPIKPNYHNRLFTDYKRRQPSLLEFQGQPIIEGNTIRKAYLCHSKLSRIRSGDIIIFYRSADEQSLTSIGVVESVINNAVSPETIIKEVGKRTVYTKKEIEDIAKKPTKVILFSLNFHFPNPISLKELKEKKLLSGSPQSITEINNDTYLKIKPISGLKGKYCFSD